MSAVKVSESSFLSAAAISGFVDHAKEPYPSAICTGGRRAIYQETSLIESTDSQEESPAARQARNAAKQLYSDPSS